MQYKEIICPSCGSHEIKKQESGYGIFSFCHSVFTIEYDDNETRVKINQDTQKAKTERQQAQLDYQKELQKAQLDYQKELYKHQLRLQRNMWLLECLQRFKHLIVSILIALLVVFVVKFDGLHLIFWFLNNK